MMPDATEWALDFNGHEDLLREVQKKQLKSGVKKQNNTTFWNFVYTKMVDARPINLESWKDYHGTFGHFRKVGR